MINLKPTIVAALKANATLTTALGGQKIYFKVAPQGVVAPYITYFEMTNFDDTFADNAPLSSEIHIQVDIFTPEGVSTSAIADQVDITMKSLGFGRTSAADLWENDTRLHHKAMRFATIKKY